MPDYDVRIETRVDDSGLKKANQSTKGFMTELRALDLALRQGKLSAEQYGKQMSDLVTRINSTNLSLKNTVDLGGKVFQVQEHFRTGFKSMSDSINKATPSVLEFNRIVQDAPFGIRGVANNIQQLSQNFIQLQKEAGGVIPAIKLMGASLMGPMGILMGISLVTSALVAFGDSGKKSVEKVTDAIKDMRDAELALYAALNKRGAMSDALYTNELQKERGRLQRQYVALAGQEPTMGVGDLISNMRSPGQGTVEYAMRLAAWKKEVAALSLQIENIDASILDVNKKTTVEVQKQAVAKASIVDGGSMMSNSDYLAIRSGSGDSILRDRMRINPFGRGQKPGAGSLAGQGRISAMRDATQPPRIAFNEWMTYSMDFQNSFMSGINTMSSQVTFGLGEAYDKVFKNAHTLLGGFLKSFLSATAEMASRAAMIWGFNLLLPTNWLNALGINLNPSIGSAGSISKLGMSSRVSGGSSGGGQFTFVQRGPDLVAVMERGQRIKRQATLLGAY